MSHPRAPRSPADVLALLRDQDIRMVDLRFVDASGRWKHFTVPSHQLTEDSFTRGFEVGEERWVPDPSTARLDPFLDVPTVALLGDLQTPEGAAASFDPRGVARRAEAHLQATGFASHALVEAQVTFFVFDDVRIRSEPHGASYSIDASSGHWNRDREEFPNLGYKVTPSGGRLVAPPSDTSHDLRTEIVLALDDLGITVCRHQHEAGSGGQARVDLQAAPLLAHADGAAWFKYVTKNVARRAGKTATFMPQPMAGEPGSGLTLRIGLWQGAENVFGGGPRLAQSFAAGVLFHAPALCALTNPSTNSYRRLGMGDSVPNLRTHGDRRRAMLGFGDGGGSKGGILEMRWLDPLTNPYLAASALILAGLEGIESQRALGDGMTEEGSTDSIPRLPLCFGDALDALASDHDFLVKDGVFDSTFLRQWIATKRRDEVEEVRTRPHPHEFALYFDG